MCVLYLAIPIGFGWYASVRQPASVSNPPEGFSNIILTAKDGIKLRTWYKPPENGAVIILIHGATGSRENVRPYAHMLAENGFGVITFDLRGNGESGGDGNSFGWECNQDVGAVVEYLLKKDDINTIGGLGISLGGEILLGTISDYPEIKAVISDGATYRSTDDYTILSSSRNLLRSWTTRLMYASVQLFSEDKPPITMLNSIKQADNTDLLLIAAGNVSKEIEYNTYYKESAPDRTDLWIVPGVGHTGAYNQYQEEYEKRVIEFLKAHLLNSNIK